MKNYRQTVKKLACGFDNWNQNDFWKSVGVGAVSGAVAGTMSAAAPAFVTSSTSFLGNLPVYAGKAGYAALSGGLSAGAGMLTNDLLDDGSINTPFKNYATGIGIAAGTAGVLSFSNSIYRYHTWDKFSIEEKIAILQKESRIPILSGDLAGTELGEYSSMDEWATLDIYKTLNASKGLSRSVVGHENIHNIDDLASREGLVFSSRVKKFNFVSSRKYLTDYTKQTERNAYKFSVSTANKYGVTFRQWLGMTGGARYNQVSRSAYNIFSLPMILRSLF